MGKTTIQWTDFTVNFWHGCLKVDEDCKYCYMYRDKEMHKQNPLLVVKRDFKVIRREINKALKDGVLFPGAKIFTCSWSDFWIEEADDWRAEAWQVIAEYPQFIWQILTKRPERVTEVIPDNVWLLTSCGSQKSFDIRVPKLMQIQAKVRGVSLEPLIGSINMYKYYPVGKGEVSFGALLDWVIVGGESGNNVGKYLYRPCYVHWIESIVMQCRKEDLPGGKIPVFVKQLGCHIAKEYKLKDRFGGNIEEFPESLKVREFPQYEIGIVKEYPSEAHMRNNEDMNDVHFI